MPSRSLLGRPRKVANVESDRVGVSARTPRGVDAECARGRPELGHPVARGTVRQELEPAHAQWPARALAVRREAFRAALAIAAERLGVAS